MGVSTVRIAKDREMYNYIGIEVFLNGFTKTLAEVGDGNLENVRLMRFDAVQVLNDMIEDGSVAGFHIFFPVPSFKASMRIKAFVFLVSAHAESTPRNSSKAKSGRKLSCCFI